MRSQRLRGTAQEVQQIKIWHPSQIFHPLQLFYVAKEVNHINTAMQQLIEEFLLCVGDAQVYASAATCLQLQALQDELTRQLALYAIEMESINQDRVFGILVRPRQIHHAGRLLEQFTLTFEQVLSQAECELAVDGRRVLGIEEIRKNDRAPSRRQKWCNGYEGTKNRLCYVVSINASRTCNSVVSRSVSACEAAPNAFKPGYQSIHT